MAVLEMKYLGDPVLRQPAEEIDTPDDELRRLARDMFDTMYAEDGVGLAGPQIGVTRRIIVVDPREEGIRPMALLNPRVVEAADETERSEEGCLSIPGLRELVDRSTSVVIEAMDLEGEDVRLEAEGLFARVLQHEVDHLEGVLFIDRLSPLKRKMLLKKWEKIKPSPEKAGA